MRTTETKAHLSSSLENNSHQIHCSKFENIGQWAERRGWTKEPGVPQTEEAYFQRAKQFYRNPPLG